MTSFHGSCGEFCLFWKPNIQCFLLLRLREHRAGFGKGGWAADERDRPVCDGVCAMCFILRTKFLCHCVLKACQLARNKPPCCSTMGIYFRDGVRWGTRAGKLRFAPLSLARPHWVQEHIQLRPISHPSSFCLVMFMVWAVGMPA